MLNISSKDKILAVEVHAIYIKRVNKYTITWKFFKYQKNNCPLSKNTKDAKLIRVNDEHIQFSFYWKAVYGSQKGDQRFK